VILWLNGFLAVRFAGQHPTQAVTASVSTPTGSTSSPNLFALMRERLPWSRVVAGGAGLLALLVATAEAGNWGVSLQFLYRVPYGADDPLYNKDIGFCPTRNTSMSPTRGRRTKRTVLATFAD